MSDTLLKCDVCQSLIDEEDLFCANCGTEAPPRQREGGAADDRPELTKHNFQCEGCGASMSYDAGAGALRCPFCGSEKLDRRDDQRQLAPRRVVPFRTTREEAIAAMRRELRRGWFRPSGLSERATVAHMTPVYLPYWVFEATTHTHWTADTSHTPPGARGDWAPLSGEHRGRYAGLLVAASGALAPGETGSIAPFDLGEGVEPDQVDREHVTVEQFSLTRKYARPRARSGIEQREAAEVDRRYVPGRSRNVHVNVLIEGLSSEPLLLPVWIMAYRYREETYRFLVNGQTGKATGDAPVCWWKVTLAFAAAVVLGLGAIWAMLSAM